jgi:hypothetical protein
MPRLRRSLLSLSVLLTGLSLIGILHLPQAAYSQQDYEAYILMEKVDNQVLRQKNTGSGSSNNINCGTNTLASNQITQNVSTETPRPAPVNLKPVITQRSVEVLANPSGTTSAEARCNPDEVVTGGGYELSEQRRSGGSGGGGGNLPPVIFINTSFKEFAMNNAWHIEIVNPDLTGTVKVHAECLKLLPA